jgi:hypothetical protein
MRRVGVVLIALLGLLFTATSVAALASAGAQPALRSLHLAIDTEGEENAYSEIYLYGDCAGVPASPARATFSGDGQHRTLTIANPCVGEWRRGGGRHSLPGLALTPHPGNGHFAASIEFGACCEDVGRHTYTLTVTYAGQKLTARITVVVTPGRGARERGYAIKVAGVPPEPSGELGPGPSYLAGADLSASRR